MVCYKALLGVHVVRLSVIVVVVSEICNEWDLKIVVYIGSWCKDSQEMDIFTIGMIHVCISRLICYHVVSYLQHAL